MTDNFDRDLFCIAGLPFDAISLQGTVSHLQSVMSNKENCFVSTPNLNFLIACQSDKEFRESVINSDLSIADGMPIVWMARLLGIPIAERVAGSSLFDELLNQDSDYKFSVFFFGGEEGVAEKACQQINLAGKAVCKGCISPGFGNVEEMSRNDWIQQINESNADFLVVALGARKGQAWLEANREKLTIPVYSHLGAVVNFVAGRVSRAPRWLQRSGLEWLWRIKEEPQLWVRYWKDGIGLLKLLITGVIPYAFWLKFNSAEKLSDGTLSEQKLIFIPGGDRQIIKLEGIFSIQNLSEPRRVFRDIAAKSTDVSIDFEAVSYVDPAFIGLLLVLRKQLNYNGNKLRLINVNTKIKKLFGWNGVKFLLDHS